MSPAETDFDLLMQQVRAGCPKATQEVFDRYSRHILRVVRRRLHKRLRRQMDSTDFLQSVWASFFDDPERFAFRTPDELMGFLATLAQNKVVDAFRRTIQGGPRDLSREQPLPTTADSVGKELPLADNRQPTPSQQAIADESWQRLLAPHPPEIREVLDMLRQGYSQQEIFKHLDVSPKRLRRVIERMKERWENP